MNHFHHQFFALNHSWESSNCGSYLRDLTHLALSSITNHKYFLIDLESRGMMDKNLAQAQLRLAQKQVASKARKIEDLKRKLDLKKSEISEQKLEIDYLKQVIAIERKRYLEAQNNLSRKRQNSSSSSPLMSTSPSSTDTVSDGEADIVDHPKDSNVQVYCKLLNF
jgi:hypothetical protein